MSNFYHGSFHFCSIEFFDLNPVNPEQSYLVKHTTCLFVISINKKVYDATPQPD